MTAYRGLTWDHPRGRRALEQTAEQWRARGVDITWDAQPLEGFEGHPIDDLAARYDLIVLDHPHLGDAVASGSLQPLGHLLTGEQFIGPSIASYTLRDEVWALPLDAATQVSARDAARVDTAPRTWDDVADLARGGGVALSLAGPHALLSLFSVASALGRAPRDVPGLPWLDHDVVAEAFEVLAKVHRSTEPDTEELNPIAMLARIADRSDPLSYVPLVYGYVTFSGGSAPVSFGDAPRMTAHGVPGSIIGGTGVAVSARTAIAAPLAGYLRWLISDDTQRRVIPVRSGQPASRAAWTDPLVDAAASGFYSGTIATIERSSVRPRAAGFPAAQHRASAAVRDALAGRTSVETLQERLRGESHLVEIERTPS